MTLYSVCQMNKLNPIVGMQVGVDIQQFVAKEIEDIYLKNGADQKFNKCLVVVLDRNQDLHSMLHHPFTYLPLVHDIMKISQNKAADKYPLDFQSDSFLKTHAFSEISEIGEEVDR